MFANVNVSLNQLLCAALWSNLSGLNRKVKSLLLASDECFCRVYIFIYNQCKSAKWQWNGNVCAATAPYTPPQEQFSSGWKWSDTTSSHRKHCEKRLGINWGEVVRRRETLALKKFIYCTIFFFKQRARRPWRNTHRARSRADTVSSSRKV